MAMHAVCSSPPPPAADVARFATQREALDAAIELACAFTGRATVITVPGPYTRATLPWLCRAMAESIDRIAALVVELEAGDDTIYPRVLKKARELASAEGAALIWCETISEAADGGAQAVYRGKADLTCLTVGDSTWLTGKPEVIGHEMPV